MLLIKFKTILECFLICQKRPSYIGCNQIFIKKFQLCMKCIPSRDIAGASASFMESKSSVLDVAASKTQKLQILGLLKNVK